ncbi:hypothetical protein BDU57DRAFT_322628 [Ampelomyces quisqualis]|uniref:Uncharacterized protein n=1 Tax=Ampelomyces quisqualis TaxID=50730 RepID=A0A6A5QEM7_AMPQU|nr:hypothetical protein BDU57DRAFT_322628 [Ampelomyces quisqualis]
MATEYDDSNRTPTPHSTRSSLESLHIAALSQRSSGSIAMVYIVTDIIYPTASDFSLSRGVFKIDSVHSSSRNANARAKKIIYDGGQVDGGQYKVDTDKIIEEVERGLFTGIGIGGKGDGGKGSCYARKCQVEGKIVDEDSEDESEESEDKGAGEERHGEGRDGDTDGDVQMG